MSYLVDTSVEGKIQPFNVVEKWISDSDEDKEIPSKPLEQDLYKCVIWCTTCKNYVIVCKGTYRMCYDCEVQKTGVPNKK